MTIKYIPVVTCEKCAKPADSVERVHLGNRRFILARCHGERAELPFADQAGQEMKVFAKEN